MIIYLPLFDNLISQRKRARRRCHSYLDGKEANPGYVKRSLIARAGIVPPVFVVLIDHFLQASQPVRLVRSFHCILA